MMTAIIRATESTTIPAISPMLTPVGMKHHQNDLINMVNLLLFLTFYDIIDHYTLSN